MRDVDMSDDQGVKYAEHILETIVPHRCLLCTKHMDEPGVNEICGLVEIYWLQIQSSSSYSKKCPGTLCFFLGKHKWLLSAHFHFAHVEYINGIET
jgi:hypothetical protein